MLISLSGGFTHWEEAHNNHWLWCWMGLRPSQKALEKETFMLNEEAPLYSVHHIAAYCW